MEERDYFPEAETGEGWRRPSDDREERVVTDLSPTGLEELATWSTTTLSGRHNTGLVIRNGWLVHEWGNTTEVVEIKSAAKALTILSVGLAIDDARTGAAGSVSDRPPLDYDRPAYDYIPEGHPLSDPRKAAITVRQLMHHLGGILPECTGVSNYPPAEAGFWEFALGRGDYPTARLYAEPGTKFLYGTYDIRHLSLVLASATGMELDDFMRARLCARCGISEWRMDRPGGAGMIGPHADFRVYTTARDLARIGALTLAGGRWKDREVIPQWLMEETFRQPFPGLVPEGFTYHWHRKRATWPACIPDDVYYTAGAGLNLLVVCPSLDLVAVRLGDAFDADWPQALRDFMVHLFGTAAETPPAPTDRSRPRAAVTFPLDGQRISGEIAVQGAADDDGEVARVEVDIDGCGDHRTATGAESWQFMWDTRQVADGRHRIFFRAFDRAGNASEPAPPVTVMVENGRTGTPQRAVG